ncbi:hypothetical protein T10_7308 [Trichinella papuae]|uniref:Uncharacterized protein n=1 Tax=Trichinella papuae TaxID=268474 RepID=A0A0V1MWX6_9BILA|nr:hypothetical protein T10_7308 [Trichinella papuae]
MAMWTTDRCHTVGQLQTSLRSDQRQQSFHRFEQQRTQIHFAGRLAALGTQRRGELFGAGQQQTERQTTVIAELRRHGAAERLERVRVDVRAQAQTGELIDRRAELEQNLQRVKQQLGQHSSSLARLRLATGRVTTADQPGERVVATQIVQQGDGDAAGAATQRVRTNGPDAHWPSFSLHRHGQEVLQHQTQCSTFRLEHFELRRRADRLEHFQSSAKKFHRRRGDRIAMFRSRTTADGTGVELQRAFELNFAVERTDAEFNVSFHRRFQVDEPLETARAQHCQCLFAADVQQFGKEIQRRLDQLDTGRRSDAFHVFDVAGQKVAAATVDIGRQTIEQA